MPAKVRYPRESIIAAAVRLVRHSGPEALNARALAKEMGCSTQPIFRVFDSMEQIHAEVVNCSTVKPPMTTATRPPPPPPCDP